MACSRHILLAVNFVFATPKRTPRRKPVHKFQLYSAGMVGTCGLRLEKGKVQPCFEVSQHDENTDHSVSFNF